MYKVVIGLEVHCELKTESKNFSSSTNTYSSMPNIHVAPVDLGLPGILPVVNKEACHKALKMALTLNCSIPDDIIFDRKNYYYPDLPKGYQITQVTKPFGKNGIVRFFVGEEEKEVMIHQIHLEEDTASLEHFSNYSLIDYNRSGVPLIEIVTEPCIYSADEAIAFLEYLRGMFLFTEVSEAKSDKGQMRCDVNISLMNVNATTLGTKVEMKNINAFNSVRASIEYEIKRQSEILDKGEKVKQETRRIDEDGKTYSMREKVDAVDYKYFIEPNLAPVKISDDYVLEVKKEIPELQYDRLKRYLSNGISFYDASILAKDKDISDYYDEVVSLVSDKESINNWMITVILGSLNKLEISIDEMYIRPSMLAGIINLVNQDELSLALGKKILYESMEIKKDPLEIVKEFNLKQITSEDVLISYVEKAISENEEQVKEYLSGKEYVANFFVGKVMALTNKQADPKLALKLIKECLERMK
ncbi:MAG: Asp-tRNA(Asn)/Glu-tRNA(Gln) amidotransferase subunit GatB [Bacilli bacterium]|nr:Asp-tRNA(Asn)/Glu-tRNA(Gln) amidotransferase subunit GatB [Bacilli bacterium]